MTVTNINEFDSYRFSLLVAKIGQVKAQFDSILEDSDTYLKGYRYKDDNRIARFVIGELYAQAGYNAVEANKKFLSLNSEEIMPLIKKGVLDAASADHHYTYEKQW